MNLIKLVGTKEVTEFLNMDSVDSDNTMIVSLVGVSYIIEAVDKLIPKSYTYYRYQILIPGPAIMDHFYMNGITDKYIELCFEYWTKPDVLFFINEMIRRGLIYDYNVALISSIEETDDMHTIDILCDRIEMLYKVKAITLKKFKKGKKSKIKDKKKLFEFTEKLRDELVHKLDILDIDLPRHQFLRITKKILKKFPKEHRKEYAQYLEE